MNKVKTKSTKVRWYPFPTKSHSYNFFHVDKGSMFRYLYLKKLDDTILQKNGKVVAFEFNN